MSALTLGTARSEATGTTADDWPHTRRPLPWLLAAFLVMLFLVPFGAIKFRLHLPADATPDRLLVVAMIVALVVGVQPRLTGKKRQLGAVEYAVLLFTAVALISVVVNASRLYRLEYFPFVEKSMLQLLSYVAFFFIVVKTVRISEIPALSRLILRLSCITAVGVLIESRTGFNVFYIWAGNLLHPIATVLPSPTDIAPTNGARAFIVGPTDHPLALASMLTMALPFAIVPLYRATRPRDRVRYVVAIALIVAATLSTREKTAMLAPLTVIVVLIAFRPRLLRWTPLGILVIIPMVHFAAPGVLGELKNLIPGSANYSDGRTGDYSAIKPDILSNLLIGRGYGSLDPLNLRWYRIFDNEYLDELWETGVIGLATYALMLWTPVLAARRIVRNSATAHAEIAMAAAAGCAAFALVSVTYDAMGFGQAIYSFLFAAALIAILAREPSALRKVPDCPGPSGPEGPSPRRSVTKSHLPRSGHRSTATPVGSSRA
jgi:putative inorganic carbon (HCO3(-)) transporter